MPDFRELPSVDQVLRNVDHHGLPSRVVTQQIRLVLSQHREAMQAGHAIPVLPIETEVDARLVTLVTPSLRHVINATGVILHTNLGRAPTPDFQPLEGYSNLEYDLAAGKRGKRDVHTAHLLEALLNVPAIVVNNNAAAVFLVLNELAMGEEVIISRGELIEIGDGFRIPEIMSRSGVILREVGTTNRTSLEDYKSAINPHTRLILRVHPSNFHVTGFTARPAVAELTTLGIPVYEDLGSGCLVDLRKHGIDEPLVSSSIQAGVKIVTFSCDKLLGGPQSGIIAGDKELVERVRRNPLYRAFRADKLVIQALESSLRYLLMQDWDQIPVLRMIAEPLETIRARATAIASQIRHARVRLGEGAIGGGSTPDQTLPTYVVEVETAHPLKWERLLRQNEPAIVARIEKGRLLLDCRTIHASEVDFVAAALSGKITE